MEPCVSCINSPIVWNMCEHLHYESVYYKELHNKREYHWPTTYGAVGAAVVSTIPSYSIPWVMICSSSITKKCGPPIICITQAKHWLLHLRAILKVARVERFPINSQDAIYFCDFNHYIKHRSIPWSWETPLLEPEASLPAPGSLLAPCWSLDLP